MKVITLLLSIVLLSSCSASNQDLNDKSQSALTLVKKVCDGENKLSWEERAELAAQANYLDFLYRCLQSTEMAALGR